jgi:hypothetical protein
MPKRGTTEEAMAGVLLALVRACRDDLRPAIREEGIDERDLAYEAGLLLRPSDLEAAIYGSQKRNSVLRVLRQMQGNGLINMEMGPKGAYRVLPTGKGEQYAEFLMRPWYRKLWSRLSGRASQPV